MATAGVDCAAVMPAAWDVAGNELVLAAAESHPDRFTAFVSPDLRRQVGVPGLAEWRDRGARGIRVMFPPTDGPSWLLDGTADWLWPAACELGMTVMVWAPGLLPSLAEVATMPGLDLVIDHLNLGMAPGAEEAVRDVDALCELAALPNVAVKASALPCAGPEGLSLLRRAVGAFGAHRVFWGSDFGRLPCTYAASVEMVAHADFLSDIADRNLVLGDAFAGWIGWTARAT